MHIYLTNFMKKVAFRENIIMNSDATIALLQCYVATIALLQCYVLAS